MARLSPNEYASNELYAAPGDVAANANILPRIGPTQGVQPASKCDSKHE